MGEIWKSVIPIAPKTKKNSQQIGRKKSGRPFVMMNPRQKAYEREFINFVNYAGDPIDRAVNVRMLFYMDTRRIVDLANLEEMALDCMVRAGILKDDNSRIVESMDGSRVLYDKEYPRTEIEVTKR